MRMNIRSMLVAGIMGLALVGGGCKSSIEKQFEAERVVISPPLDHDPTDTAALAQWWASDWHLLRLEENAAYALFEGTNRYAPPIERGRWTQQSYAVLWLEPYNTIRVAPRRVSITKVDGKLALRMPNTTAPLYAVARPPIVLEDRLVGGWEGPLGELHLNENLRYALTPRVDDPPAGAPQIYAMRKGSWKIADNQLVLLSDIPGVEPLRLPLEVHDEAITIAAPGGTMNKRQRSTGPAGAPASAPSPAPAPSAATPAN